MSDSCASTIEPLQNMQFELNNVINSKASLCQGDVTKINVDAIGNTAQ